jgi:hypothetical protein
VRKAAWVACGSALQPLDSEHARPPRSEHPALTHEFMAGMLGLQRSTLSTVTYKLQTAGLIRQSRGSITVTDRAGLEQTACECYGKVRRIYERLLLATYPRAPAQ